MLDVLRGPSSEEQLIDRARIKADLAYEHGQIDQIEYQIRLEAIGIPIYPVAEEHAPLIDIIRGRVTTIFDRLQRWKTSTEVFSGDTPKVE